MRAVRLDFVLELRATTSLACLLRDQGRSADAVACLRLIYDRFTDGFDGRSNRSETASGSDWALALAAEIHLVNPRVSFVCAANVSYGSLADSLRIASLRLLCHQKRTLVSAFSISALCHVWTDGPI